MQLKPLFIVPVVVLIAVGVYIANTPADIANNEADTATVSKAANKVKKGGAVADFAAVEGRPDFKNIADVQEKKDTFFQYMLPMIREANAGILADREIVEGFSSRVAAGEALSAADSATLAVMFENYRMNVEATPTPKDLAELLVRTDVVPASLVLAQSANESGWGTSRFAVRANNFFGLWCFNPGCGLTPQQRNDGATHEVAKFDEVDDGVAYYVYTINTNNAYKELRRIRAGLREDDRNITGVELAEGLLRYSERGEEYVKEIQSMIEYNKLSEYTLATAELDAPRPG
jgi:Bax protein